MLLAELFYYVVSVSSFWKPRYTGLDGFGVQFLETKAYWAGWFWQARIFLIRFSRSFVEYFIYREYALCQTSNNAAISCSVVCIKTACASAGWYTQGPREIKRREVELDPQVSPEEIMSREVELDPQVSPEEIMSREVELDPQVSPEEIMSREVELDPQVSPEEIMSREVELDPQVSPEEIMSREVELDPQVSPEGIMSREVELCCDFASGCYSTAVQRTLSL